MPFPSPRRLLAASATLFPAVLLFGHAEASILERCTADSQPRIGGAPALCIAPDYSSYRFIQSNEDGVLVVELDRETVDSGVPGLDGATVVQLNGRPGRLVYCSAESLQAGVADCGTNLAATDADPGVFVGTGKVYGDLRLDA